MANLSPFPRHDGLKASLGAVHAGSQSIMPVWILVTAVINFIAVLYSAKFVDEVL